MKIKYGFTMLEIVIALVILAFGLLPVFNLFRQNNATTTNNIQETIATNYASDMINFCKDLRYSQVAEEVSGKTEKLDNDEEIKAFFDRLKQNVPTAVEKPFIRSMTIKKYETKSLGETFKEFWNLLTHGDKVYSVVPAFLVTVKVAFPRTSGKVLDEVTLYTIIMD